MRRKISLKLNKKNVVRLEIVLFFRCIVNIVPEGGPLEQDGMAWQGNNNKETVNNGSTVEKKKKKQKMFSGGFRFVVANWKLRRMKAVNRREIASEFSHNSNLSKKKVSVLPSSSDWHQDFNIFSPAQESKKQTDLDSDRKSENEIQNQ